MADLRVPLLSRLLRAAADAIDAGELATDAGDEWVDQHASPLGRRDHCRYARTGALGEASKLGKRWLVRRRAIDAFILAHRVAPASDGGDHVAEDELDAGLRRAGL